MLPVNIAHEDQTTGSLNSVAVSGRCRLVYMYIYIYIYIHISVCLHRVVFNNCVITRHYELESRQNSAGILPASLPELPIQLRDVRSNQKFSKTYF